MLSAENAGSLIAQTSSLPDPITNCYYTYGFADEDSDFDEMDIDTDALLNADTKSLASEFVSIDDAVKHTKESNSDLLNTIPVKEEPLTHLDSNIRNIFYVFKDFEDNCKQNNSGCFPFSGNFKHYTPLKHSTAYNGLKNKEVHSDTEKEAKCVNLYKPHDKKQIESPSKNNDLFTVDFSHYVWPKSTSVADGHLLQDARSVSEFYRPKKLTRTIKSDIYKGLCFFTNALDPRQQCDSYLNGTKPSLKDGNRTQDECISLKASETSEHFTANWIVNNAASHNVKCMKFSPARDSPKHTASQNSGEICRSKSRSDVKESTKSTPVKNIAEISLTSNDKRDFSKFTPVKNVSKVATSKDVSRKSVKNNTAKNIVEIIAASDVNSATKFRSAINSETSLTSERKNSSKSASDKNISEISIINNEVSNNHSTAKNIEVGSISKSTDKDSTKLTPSKDAEVNILCKEKDSTRVTPVAEIKNSTLLCSNTSCRDTNFDLSLKNSCNVSALDAGAESVHNPKRNLNSEINADKPVLTISNDDSQNAVEKIKKSKLKRKIISDDTEATKKKIKEVSPENPECVHEKVSDIIKCSSCFLTHLAQVRDATVSKVHSKSCSQCEKGNKLVCPKCGLQCPNLLVLYAHLLNVSNKQHKKVAQFCCSSCKMLSDSQFHFYNHVAFSNCSKLCIFCDHIFKSRKQKDSHTCKKAGTKKYFKRLSISSEVILQCQTCSKVVTSAKVKTGSHYNCDQCLKSEHKKSSRQTVSVKEYKDRQKEKESKKDCDDSITAKSNSHVKDNSTLPEGLKKQPPSDIVKPGLNQEGSIENIANASAIPKNCNASVNIQSREITTFTISINNTGSKLENENPATPSTDQSEIFTNHVNTCDNTPDDTNVKSSKIKIKDSSLNAQSPKDNDCTDVFKSTKKDTSKLKIVNSESHSTRSPVLKLFCNELKANTNKITPLDTQFSPNSTKSPKTSTHSAISSRKMSPGVADTTKVKLSPAYTAKSSKTEVSSSNVLKSSETKLSVTDKKTNSMENTSSKSKAITKTLSLKTNDSLSLKKKTTTTNTNNSVSQVSGVKSPTIKRSHTLELRKSPVKRACLFDLRNQEDVNKLQETPTVSSTSPSIKVHEAKTTPSVGSKPAVEVQLNTSDKHAAVKKGSSTHKAAVKEIPTSEKPTITKTNSFNKLEVGIKVSCTDKLIKTDANAATKQSITMSKPEKSKVNGSTSATNTSALTEVTGSKPPDTEISFDKTEVIVIKIITSPKPAVDKIKKVDKGSREFNALDNPTVTKETKTTKPAVKELKTPKPEVTSVYALPKPGGCKGRSAAIKVNNTPAVSISKNNDSDKATASDVVPFDKPALSMVNTTKSVVNKANTSKSGTPQVIAANKPALSRINTKTIVPNMHTSGKPASSDLKNDKLSKVITTSTPKPAVSKLTVSNKSAIEKSVAGGYSTGIAKPTSNQDNSFDEKRAAVSKGNTANEPKASKVNTLEKSAVSSVSTSKKSSVTEVSVSKKMEVAKLNASNKLAVTKVNVSKPALTKVITPENSVVAWGNNMPKPKVNPDKALDNKRSAVTKVNTETESKISKINTLEKPAVCSVSTSSSNKKSTITEISVSEKLSVTKPNASNKSAVAKVITLSKTAETKVNTSETSLVAGANSVLVPKSIVTQDNVLENNRLEVTKVNTTIKPEEETAVTNVTSEALVTNMNASNKPALVKVDSQDKPAVTSLDETNAILTKMIPSEEKNTGISQTNVTALDSCESHLKSSSLEPKCICKQNSSLPDSTSLDSTCSSNNLVLNSVAPKNPVSDLVKVVSDSNSPQSQQSNGLSSVQSSVIHTETKCPLYSAQDITKCEIPKSETQTQMACKENNKKTDKLPWASHASGGSSNCNFLSTNCPIFCRICGWGARSYYHLDEHLAGAHHMKKKYFCRVGPCNCSFVLERCLDIHRDEHDYMEARNSNMERMHTERPKDWCADDSFCNPKTRCQTFINNNTEWQGSRCGDAESSSFRNYNSFDDMDFKSRRQSFHNTNRFENINTGMPTFPTRKRFADSFDDIDCMIAKKVCQSSGVFNACKTDCYGRPVVVQVYQFISTSDHVSVNYIHKSNYPHSNVRVINVLPHN
uniref:ShKT domain-containing protein n=1 Tax=Biomphalaria glabrata TaxID=6526 RepID=A0A2C9LP92_BIOGL